MHVSKIAQRNEERSKTPVPQQRASSERSSKRAKPLRRNTFSFRVDRQSPVRALVPLLVQLLNSLQALQHVSSFDQIVTFNDKDNTNEMVSRTVRWAILLIDIPLRTPMRMPWTVHPRLHLAAHRGMPKSTCTSPLLLNLPTRKGAAPRGVNNSPPSSPSVDLSSLRPNNGRNPGHLGSAVHSSLMVTFRSRSRSPIHSQMGNTVTVRYVPSFLAH